MADSSASGAGRSSVPPPGPLGAVDVLQPRQTVVDALEAALSKRPRYSPGTRRAMRRVATEAGMAAASTRDAAEVTGLANPYFSETGAQLKRAAMRYIQIPEGSVSPEAKISLTEFVGSELLFNGCSATSQRITCTEVCDVLLGCAKRAGLVAPSMLASLQQFFS